MARKASTKCTASLAQAQLGAIAATNTGALASGLIWVPIVTAAGITGYVAVEASNNPVTTQ